MNTLSNFIVEVSFREVSDFQFARPDEDAVLARTLEVNESFNAPVVSSIGFIKLNSYKIPKTHLRHGSD
jgi:hypothetical protein